MRAQDVVESGRAPEGDLATTVGRKVSESLRYTDEHAAFKVHCPHDSNAQQRTA